MAIFSGSTAILLSILAGLLLLAIFIDALIQRRRAVKKQAELQQTIVELQSKLIAVERSLHGIGQRLLMDEKVIRELKDTPVVQPGVSEISLVNSEYPGQIAAWYEQEAPDTMTEAESVLQAMLKQRRAIA